MLLCGLVFVVIIDYFNFLYLRYPDITEQVIKKNLALLGIFFEDKNMYVRVVFDGVRFQYIVSPHKKISLIFSGNRSADDVIIEMFKALQGKAHTLVSRDRRLGSIVQSYAKSMILDPLLLWRELDFFSKNTSLFLKKSALIKMTDYEDDLLDDLYKRIK